MSGVVAVFARDGAPVGAVEVDGILQRQAHRGPDGLRVWCDGPIGLGFAALDPAGAGAAVDPLVTDGGRLAVVGDLRIDNRHELRVTLGGLRTGASDAEIVLESYRRWGVDAPCHLEGAFAFSIWDARCKRLFCARDHLGVKPLVYHLSPELFVCASEADAVPVHPRVPRRINQARIADFLVSELEGVDHISTFFEGVERLPPAHFLVVDTGSHRLSKYWRPDPTRELQLESDEAYAEVFATTFRRAVRSCLTGVARPALMLSGGIDSGAVAAFARSLVNAGQASPLTTYSVVDEESDRSPETAMILAMIEHLGLAARTISPARVAELAPAARRALPESGEPFDSSMVVANLLYSMAAEAGSRTILDGVDGDIVASIAVPTAHLLRRGRVRSAWREAAGRRRLWPGAPTPLRSLAGGALRAWLPGGLNRVARNMRNRRGRVADAIRASLIDPEFARKIQLADRLDRLWNHDRSGPAGDPRSAHVLTVAHPNVAGALERYDRVAARRGVETRHPFFDLRLVSLCLSLPWDLKVRNGWTKFVLRLATEGVVLDAVRRRHDYGDVLWRPTSRVIAEERQYLQSILTDQDDELRLCVDHTKLDRVRHFLGGNPTDEEEVCIWELASLAIWLARQRPTAVGLASPRDEREGHRPRSTPTASDGRIGGNDGR